MSALRIAALCLCVSLLLCGCEKQENSSAPVQEEKTSRQTTTAIAPPVEVKDYKFPEFLDSDDTSDMLSNVVVPGFDRATATSAAADVVFGKYKPYRCLLGEYYLYRENGKLGLLNSDGGTLVRADRYVDAEPVSDHLIKFEYPAEDKKEPDLLFVNAGRGMIVENKFNEKNIKLDEIENDDGKTQYSLNIMGVQDSRRYDTLTPVSGAELKTAMSYRAAYRATAGQKRYYLLLDEYYNITVCEGAYGKIALKAGGRYGECYILDGDHYSELYKMITSFGSMPDPVKPSKEETLDFVQITFGMDGTDRTVITVSSEGVCLRDQVTNSGQNVNKYFQLFPRETFTDLVNWVGEVAAAEYPSGRKLLEGDSE